MRDIICVTLAADAQVNNENPKLFYRHAKEVPSIIGLPKSENNLLDKGIKSPPLRGREGNKTTVAKVNHYFLLYNHYQKP